MTTQTLTRTDDLTVSATVITLRASAGAGASTGTAWFGDTFRVTFAAEVGGWVMGTAFDAWGNELASGWAQRAHLR